MSDSGLPSTKSLLDCSKISGEAFFDSFDVKLDGAAQELLKLLEALETENEDSEKPRCRIRRSAGLSVDDAESTKSVQDISSLKTGLTNITELHGKFLYESFVPLQESISSATKALKEIMEEMPDPDKFAKLLPYWKVLSSVALILTSAVLRYLNKPTNAKRILKVVDMIMHSPNAFDENFWTGTVVPVATELYNVLTDKNAKLPVKEEPRQHLDQSWNWRNYKKQIATLLMVFFTIFLNYLGYTEYVVVVINAIKQILGVVVVDEMGTKDM